MKHATTREVFAYWDTCRGDRLAPDRSDIEPGAIRSVLCDTFILTFDRKAGHPFRLAGTRLCALMGCELKDEPFADLWNDHSRKEIENLLKTIAEETIGLVASVTGEAEDGQTLDLELLLLPLSHRGRMPARLLGALTPLRPPYWAGVKPVFELKLGQYRHLGPAVDIVSAPHFRAAPTEQTDRRGLVVLQ
ncbi:MAG: PAS domain-containing protein, partial [Pseudorhodoplanes sp.]